MVKRLPMEKAAEKAREGDLAYFEALSPEELTRLCKRKVCG